MFVRDKRGLKTFIGDIVGFSTHTKYPRLVYGTVTEIQNSNTIVLEPIKDSKIGNISKKMSRRKGEFFLLQVNFYTRPEGETV